MYMYIHIYIYIYIYSYIYTYNAGAHSDLGPLAHPFIYRFLQINTKLFRINIIATIIITANIRSNIKEHCAF